jgi:trk system potassium uptake protein TrkH
VKPRVVLRCVGAIVMVVGATMATAVPVALLMGDAEGVAIKFLLAALGTIAIGAVFAFHSRDTGVGIREGFAIVTFSWLGSALVAAVPYVWIGGLSPVDACFESMSGFTTTGATILTDIEAFGEGAASLLYWRSMTQWLGGMGIVVLSLAILPILGIGGMQLYKAEAPGPTSDQLTPRIANTAKILWLIYVALTLLETVLLAMSPHMTLFEAWCHACTSLASGGFSTRNASIAGFESAYVEWVIIVFMFLAAINFVLHLRALSGKPLAYWQDDECRFYCGLALFAIVSIGTCLYIDHRYASIGEIIRHTCFTVCAIISSTGYCTEDYDSWPTYARWMVLLLMFTAGCAGSTSGGMKIARIMLLLRYARQQLVYCLYPRAVTSIHMNDQRVTDTVMGRILGFAFIYAALLFFLTLLLSVIEPGLFPSRTEGGMMSAFATAVSALSNIGPGFGAIGPTQTFAWMADHTKAVLVLAMLIGRLEIYTVIVLMLPSFWRR